MEKLDYLIEYLLKENKNIKIDEVPMNKEAKKRLYRSLCNIREPKPIEEEYIKIENEYLQEELQKKEIPKVENVKTIADIFPNSTLEYKDKIGLWKGDITLLKIDAIVNAANSQGLGCFIPCHKCIDNAIHSSSGVQLRLECNEKMEEIEELETGKAFLTKGYNLPAKYVIHTVGPIIYTSVTEKEERQLKECYINSLEIARENKIRTIAFPCISTGEFRFPKEEACKIAIEAVMEYLRDNEMYFDKVVFNVFGEEDYEIYLKHTNN